MKDWGYGQGYRHAHEFQDAITNMSCLPEELQNEKFYEPSDRGLEKRVAERMAEIEDRKRKQQ